MAVIEERLDKVLAQVKDEYRKARQKHNPMNSAHEGYAVILEELEELWDAVKANDNGYARKEAVQVAAMAVAFMLEV